MNELLASLGLDPSYAPAAYALVAALGAAAVVFFIVAFLRAAARQEGKYRRAANLVPLLVTIPRELDENGNAPSDPKSTQEKIAVAETILANLGSLKPQAGFGAWWHGREDVLSLEIVARDKLIYFYVVVPRALQLFVEQQLHAQYPAAEILPAPDYNLFRPDSVVAASEMKLAKDYVFPLKTYRHADSDPLGPILTALSRFGENEAGAVQLAIRSAGKSWHSRCKKFADAVGKGKSVGDALADVKGGLIHTLFSGGKKKDETPRAPTPQEQELAKNVEEKSNKAGFEASVRLIAVAADETTAQANLHNLENAFGHFNAFEYGNGLEAAGGKGADVVAKRFIYRELSGAGRTVLNTEEVASLFHLPLPSTDVPNVVWLQSKKSAAPTNIPAEGITLGFNEYRGRSVVIKMKDQDRFRHLYVIGKSGTGKSTLQENMAVQDIRAGRGVIVIDPHGELATNILRCVPKERAEDVIYFNPAETERPMGLNMLEFDERYPEQKTFVINEMLKIFDKLYDLKSTGGPMFEYYMRNAMLLIMDSPETGSTLLDIPRVLSDENFRAMKLRACTNQAVKDFWLKEALKAGGEAALQNIVPYIASKLTPFVSNDVMRPIVGQQRSSFNVRQAMDEGKIILLNLSKGKLGELNAYLIGMVLVGKILAAALSRADMEASERTPSYLYIDEFQNFLTDSIGAILSEARKYGLSLCVAHQFIGQLAQKGDSSVRDAIFGNVGTMAVFRIGSDDAKDLVKEFRPTFGEQDLINIPARTAYMKLLIDGTAAKPFNMATYPPFESNKPLGDLIARLSSLKYGRDRHLVEEEIRLRALQTAAIAEKSAA